MLTSDELYEKLNSELSQIQSEVSSLKVNQHVFWEVQGMIRKNPNLRRPSTFYGWMGNLYAAAMTAAVRRLVDQRKDVISFVRFLDQVKTHPSCVSREAYKKRFTNPNLPLKYMDKDYDRLVGVGILHPERKKIEIEIQALKSIAEPLKQFVDERIAHTSKQQAKTLPKFDDLDRAIDKLEALTLRYLHLFRGAAYPSGLLPTWQYDWKEIFHYPWIADQQREH